MCKYGNKGKILKTGYYLRFMYITCTAKIWMKLERQTLKRLFVPVTLWQLKSQCLH